MDTNECIEFLKKAKTAYYSPRDIEKKYWDKIDCIIKRLQMWEDFKEKYGNCVFKPLDDRPAVLEDLLNNIMYEFEQEYFPKPKIRKEVRIEVLAENEDVIDELAKEIEDMNGRIFDKGKIRIVTTRWERN